MDDKKSLIDEFWENVKLPIKMSDVVEDLFNELANFVDPRSYGAEGILKSIVKLFVELVE